MSIAGFKRRFSYMEYTFSFSHTICYPQYGEKYFKEDTNVFEGIIKNTPEGFVIEEGRHEARCNMDGLRVDCWLRDPYDAIRGSEIPLSKKLREQLFACVTMDPKQVARSKEGSAISFDKIQSRVMEDIDSWARVAAACRFWRYVEDIQSIQYPDSTGNQWRPIELQPNDVEGMEISNHAYSAMCRVYNDRWRGDRFKDFPYAVKYRVSVANINGLKSAGKILKDVEKEHFSTVVEAKKYAAGRVAMLNKRYFSALDPVIPLEDRYLFLVHDVEIPGYNYQKEDK